MKKQKDSLKRNRGNTMSVQQTMRAPILKTVLIAIALSLATYSFDYLPAFYFDKSIYRILLSCVLICWLVRLKFVDVLYFSWRSFAKGFICGGFLFLFTLYVLIMNLLSVEAYLSIEVIANIFSAIMIGVLEELIWRGALLNVLLRRETGTARNPLPSVLISSLIFGLGHYCNLVFGSPFLEITLQVYAAICMGVLLAAIYIRSRNIWTCALLHALWNFSNWIGSQIFIPTTQAVSSEPASAVIGITQILGNMIEPTIFLLLGLFLLRRMIRNKQYAQSI